MKIWSFNIILLALLSFPNMLYSQVKCTNPDPPVLSLVSVQPETGFADLKWSLSPSSNVSAYLIYADHENPADNTSLMIIDTIWDPTRTTYLYMQKKPNSYSLSFVVSAYRSDSCQSALSNSLKTIYTKTAIDTCNRKITISWNPYTSNPKKVVDYSILASLNSGDFLEAGKTSAEKNSFDFNEFISNTNYCFVVRANLEDGTFSTSNKACISTKMQRPPDWINADYATVNQTNNIALSFSVDPLSQISSYRLERKRADETDFSLITKLETKEKKITYTDKAADPGKISYYRLLAVNNCGNPIVSSNLSCNIVPVLDKNDNVLKLSWNSYRSWLGEVSGYRIFIDKGNGFDEYSAVPPADTSFIINYSSVMYDITGAKVCFRIDASETANPHGVNGETVSSPVCTDITENVFVPNAFTPDNDLINDYFRPVLSFTPVEYHIVITDRSNNIMFESRDHLAEWDGKKNGERLTQGVYLWFLKIKTPSGKLLTRSGTVTIIK